MSTLIDTLINHQRAWSLVGILNGPPIALSGGNVVQGFDAVQFVRQGDGVVADQKVSRSGDIGRLEYVSDSNRFPSHPRIAFNDRSDRRYDLARQEADDKAICQRSGLGLVNGSSWPVSVCPIPRTPDDGLPETKKWAFSRRDPPSC